MVALNRKLLVSIGSSKYIFTTGERELALGVAAWERLDVDTVCGDCLKTPKKVWDIERALIFQWGIYYRDVT